MTGITRRTLDTAGGTQLAGGQSWFFVDGQPVVVRGDPIKAHGPLPHKAAIMAQGSDYWALDKIAVCRAGHLASCKHASTGADWFFINGGTV